MVLEPDTPHAPPESWWKHSWCRNDDDATLAERHILRLRGELVAIKAAREAVKAETDKLLPLPALPPNRGFRRQLSSGSESAILDMVSSGISPPDYVRARHFLLLARQWGDSDEAKANWLFSLPDWALCTPLTWNVPFVLQSWRIRFEYVHLSEGILPIYQLRHLFQFLVFMPSCFCSFFVPFFNAHVENFS